MGTREYSVTMSLRLHKDGEKIFSPQLAELLTRIDRCASIRTAALEMNIAYSNAWTMLRASEAALGFPLIERKVGGPGGGGSELTEQGRTLLEKYLELQRRTEGYAAQALSELFGGGPEPR